MTGVVSRLAAAHDLPAPASYFEGWDHVELWVGNARAFAAFLTSGFGFDVIAFAGPQTGVRDRVSYVCAQGDIRVVVTGALSSSSPIAEHVRAHGDGVRDVAIRVLSATEAYEAAVARGAVGARRPWTEADRWGRLVRSTIAVYGDTRHTFVERAGYRGLFGPGFEGAESELPRRGVGPAVGLEKIDHCVANVDRGSLDRWVDFYRDTLGFEQLVHFDDEQISTEYSALMSTVVWDGNKVVLPINEPAEGRHKSQIQEYLEGYGGPGIQHIAMRTADIVSTVRALRDRGVRFLAVPDAYYDEGRSRMAGIELPWPTLRELGILVDRDHDGHLLQIFTENVTDRPTVFFEIIQREGARGFGAGNFRALFEAIEREQARRGNL